MKIPIFPGKYHQNGGFSMAMLVYQRVPIKEPTNHQFWNLQQERQETDHQFILPVEVTGQGLSWRHLLLWLGQPRQLHQVTRP